MKKKAVLTGILVVFIVLALSGCMPGNERYTPDKPAGFLWGIWHDRMVVLFRLLHCYYQRFWRPVPDPQEEFKKIKAYMKCFSVRQACFIWIY